MTAPDLPTAGTGETRWAETNAASGHDFQPDEDLGGSRRCLRCGLAFSQWSGDRCSRAVPPTAGIVLGEEEPPYGSVVIDSAGMAWQARQELPMALVNGRPEPDGEWQAVWESTDVESMSWEMLTREHGPLTLVWPIDAALSSAREAGRTEGAAAERERIAQEIDLWAMEPELTPGFSSSQPLFSAMRAYEQAARIARGAS